MARDSQNHSTGEASTREITHSRFPCEQCGALLTYAIGSNNLRCSYCGHENAIQVSDNPVREYDIHRALRELESAVQRPTDAEVLHCSSCAAEFNLDADIHAGACPYCGASVVAETSQYRPIQPKALLPFSITADEARDHYKQWLSKLWFAPGALKKYARRDTRLNGVYIPYWTYDSFAETYYSGQRGDVYYVRQSYVATVNGRPVRRTRSVPKIRWTPVSGRTQRHFDDVLIGASRSLPRKIMDWLQPWDLANLLPYSDAYLSGFSSEVYQVDLNDGFQHAKQVMESIIQQDVRASIGGDQQRIRSMQTQHSDTTFKHILLPLWSAAFTFRGKTYRFVVNGRNGKTRGERPWSWVKITLAVITAAVVLAAFLIASGLLQNMDVMMMPQDGVFSPSYRY